MYTQDFLTIGKIASLVSALENSYPGLKLSTVQSLMRVLQRKIARTREELKRSQPGRLDVQRPSWDGSHLVHHTYVFESEKAKQNFVNNLRYATLQLKDENKMPWVCAECAEDDDVIIDSVGHLPLFVESYTLTNNSECLTTECATRTNNNTVWFSSCSHTTAEVAIIQSVTPKPILLKSFTITFGYGKQVVFKNMNINADMELRIALGGVLLVSHDEHLISLCCNDVWLCKDKLVHRLEGGLDQYKKAIQSELQTN